MEERKKLLSEIKIGLHFIYMGIGYIGISFIASIYELLLILITSHITIDVNALSAINLFLSYGTTVVLLIYLGYVFKPFIPYLKSLLKEKNEIIEGIIIAACAFAGSMGYGILSTMIFGELGSNSNQSGLDAAFMAKPIMCFFTIVIFAPICEEFTYRYGLFGVLARKSKTLAWVITIIIFALIHFDFTTLGNWELLKIELVNLPSYLIGSTFLTYAFARKNNILTSIVAHSVYNLSQYVLMLVSLFLLWLNIIK